MKLVTHTIFSLLFLIAYCYSAKAQETALRPFEGATHSYQWNGLQEGDRYNFYITADAEGNSVLDDGMFNEFNFIDSNSGKVKAGSSSASAQIKWNEGASFRHFFLWIEIAEDGGCSNYRFVEIHPQPNSRFIGFDLVTSNVCFNSVDNGFGLTINLLDNDGKLLPKNQFPVGIEFAVNGTIYRQILESAADELQITNSMFDLNPEEDTEISVEITGTVDRFGAELLPLEGKNIHKHIIFGRPFIEFTQL